MDGFQVVRLYYLSALNLSAQKIEEPGASLLQEVPMETKKRKTFPKAVFFAGAVAALGAVAVQTFIFLFYYEESVSLYAAGTKIPAVYSGCIFGMTAIVLLLSLFIKKGSIPGDMPAADRLTSFFAMLSGLLFLAAAAFTVYLHIMGGQFSLSYLRIAATALAVLASFYFFATAVARSPKRTPYVFMGLLVIVWAIVYLMCIYFEMDSPLNNPVRELNQRSLILIMLYFLFELRYVLNRRDGVTSSVLPKPKLYFAISIIAMLMVLPASVSDIILTFSGVRAVGADTYFRMAEASVVLYIFARCKSVIQSESSGEVVYNADSAGTESSDTDAGMQSDEIPEIAETGENAE